MKISLGVGVGERRRILGPVLPPQTWTPVVYNGVTNDPAYTFTNVTGSDGTHWDSGWDSNETLAGDFLTEGYFGGNLNNIFFGMRDLALGRGAGFANGRAWWRTTDGGGTLVAGSSYDTDVSAGTLSPGTTKLGIKRVGTSVEFYKDDVLVNTFTNAGFAGDMRLWGTMLWRTSECRVIRWDAL